MCSVVFLLSSTSLVLLTPYCSVLFRSRDFSRTLGYIHEFPFPLLQLGERNLTVIAKNYIFALGTYIGQLAAAAVCNTFTKPIQQSCSDLGAEIEIEIERVAVLKRHWSLLPFSVLWNSKED